MSHGTFPSVFVGVNGLSESEGGEWLPAGGKASCFQCQRPVQPHSEQEVREAA